MNKEKIIKNFTSKASKIAIIGMGYVGLPLSLRFSECGYKVLGIDIDESKVDLINNGESYIAHIPSTKIKDSNTKGFEASSDFSKISECDGIILCVPTPLTQHREPDISYVVSSIKLILPHLRKGQVISLESTTYPGTCEEEIAPRLESTGMNLGDDIFLVYSPEREDPGNKNFNVNSIPKIIGGHTENCLSVGMALYSSAIESLIEVKSTKVAEMTKLLENIHRAVNIGFINEMKVIANKMDIDIFDVVNAAESKPFGFTAYFPGPGIGGHCIPIDPFYLTWKAKEFGLNTRFIELAGEINTSMPEYVCEKSAHALNSFSKSIKNSKILILGVAYKKHVDDVRESPSLEVINILTKKGANISFSDPYINSLKKNSNIKNFESIDLSEASISSFDLVVLLTDHDDFDYDLILTNSKVIVDSRGRFQKSAKVIRA
jgi:UDP-N-acetyl-D-glucosamine dehydrogenase